MLPLQSRLFAGDFRVGPGPGLFFKKLQPIGVGAGFLGPLVGMAFGSLLLGDGRSFGAHTTQ
jgi:hypothetical protein